MIIPVILSGGSGTRLWPLSRKFHPKQFLNLVNEKTSVFQDTILRLPKDADKPLVICNDQHRFLVAEQARQVNVECQDIILEPDGKNTAPAIALAALKLKKNDIDPLLLVLPADHIIKDIEAFHKSIKVAEKLALKNKLISFGIVPKEANTGYGYIEAKLDNTSDFYSIQSFKEKPDKKIAIEYLKSGNYLWNSGMFLFKASVFLSELMKYNPEILHCCEKSLETDYKDLDFTRLENEEFLKCPEQSIDYAIMEHTKNAVVVPINYNWNDIGSWESLMGLKNRSEEGNVSHGDVIFKHVKNTYAYSSNRLISALGVSDLVIVDTQDALLITNKTYSQSIKSIIDDLKKNNRSEAYNHRKVYRPWGYYDSVDKGDGFQVKRILVQPGAKLSLQKHTRRAEHWVIVSGSATITRGNKTFTLEKNQSTFIPIGEIHRLENEGEIPLEIIEIQTGDYFGEDDIIRLEDDYQRD